jgi:hypothetical protein
LFLCITDLAWTTIFFLILGFLYSVLVAFMFLQAISHCNVLCWFSNFHLDFLSSQRKFGTHFDWQNVQSSYGCLKS